jgi:HK97 gp10 family phage protein
MVDMTITGGAEMEQQFKLLDATLRGDLLEDAVVPQADAVANLARAYAPRRTGRMADSIHDEIAEVDAEHIDVVIGPDDKYWYARFPEFGTASHEDGEGVHPGTTAQPFLRRALDERQEVVVMGIGRTIGDALESLAVS